VQKDGLKLKIYLAFFTLGYFGFVYFANWIVIVKAHTLYQEGLVTIGMIQTYTMYAAIIAH
jgi:hypothetical protein